MSRPAKPAKGATQAVRAAESAAIDFEIRSYDHDPDHPTYGEEAADKLGLDRAIVHKTLVALVDGAPVVAIVPVASRLDLKALARAMGGKKAEMAPADHAERATGYLVGAISPLGQKRSLPTVLDEGATGHERIWMSGGRRGLELGLRPADLIRLTGASVAPITTTAGRES